MFRRHHLLTPLFIISKSDGEDNLRYRFQYYDEEDGRIDVLAHYLDYRHDFDTGTALGLRFAVDSLSGETPVGTHEILDDSSWFFQEIEDERISKVVTIEHEIDEYLLSFEYAHSKESDYESDSLALRLKTDLFDKNTTITGGVAMAFDTVIHGPFTTIKEDQDKDTLDLSLGVSQLLGPNTVLDFTLGYGRSEGYLADPYRKISQTRTEMVVTPVGTFPVTDTFSHFENRPDHLDYFVARISARHYFESLHGSLQGSYRFFDNSDSITGHTFEIRWNQEINEKVHLSPFFRYYRQSGANYYYATLTDSGIMGHDSNDGSGPHYSSDYRLSALETFTYGIHLSYEPIEDLTIDLQYERYEMFGRAPGTPDIFFPSANVFSIGAQWRF